MFAVHWLSYRLWTAPTILIKTHWKNIKAQKRFENIEVWLLYLIFIFLLIFSVCLPSDFVSDKQTWRMFCKIIYNSQKLLEITKILNPWKIPNEKICLQWSCMFPGINTNTTKSDFLLLYFVNSLGTPISRNAFLWLLPPFTSSIYSSVL